MLRFSTPPLSGESLTGHGFRVSERPFFGGKKRAFTLAEVLITLVIIGVVAALTIPNLMQKYTEQATVKKVQKFYSNLSNAYALAVKENGPVEDWGNKNQWGDKESAEKVYEILFKPYFKIAKNCGGENRGNCIVRTQYKALNNEGGNSGGLGNATTHYKFVLDDGSAVIFFTPNSSVLYLFYDTNGIKEPNQYGTDTFYFVLTKNSKVIPRGLPGYDLAFDTYCKADAPNKTGGLGCAAWVIYKGNMDYLHCDGLTWNSRSCKDK